MVALTRLIRSTAADRCDDVHTCFPRNGRIKSRALAVHVHVNVMAERRPGLAQTVAKARPGALELVDDVADRVRLHVESPRQPRKERLQRRREMNVGHQPILATSTDEI